METIYEKYMALPIDKGLLCLEYGDIAERIFAIPSTQSQSDLKDVFCIAFCRNMEKWYLPAIQKVV